VSELEEDKSEDMALEEESEKTDLDNLSSSAFEDEEEEDNPHGFVYAHNLDTFRRSKRDRLAELRATQDKDEHRKSY
jgi:hypothetical protein